MKRLLFIGPLSGTSRQRQLAFGRSGYEVDVIDPRKKLPPTILFDAIEWHLTPALLSWRVFHSIEKQLLGTERNFYDIAFVDGGSLINAKTVDLLKKYSKSVVAFNHDDPFGPRDWIRFGVFRKAVYHYDLVVVVRKQNIQEAKSYGARRVLYTYRTADTFSHSSAKIDIKTKNQWFSRVLFVGTWMPERGAFLSDLIMRGVPLTIYGSGWKKAPEWSILKSAWLGDDLGSEDYASAIKSAQICLGLLSKGNRDLHTTRSIEIPAMGAVLCAERTEEHTALYVEGSEAVFWSSAEECAAVCRMLLNDEDRLVRIGSQAAIRALKNNHTNENLIRSIELALEDDQLRTEG